MLQASLTRLLSTATSRYIVDIFLFCHVLTRRGLYYVAICRPGNHPKRLRRFGGNPPTVRHTKLVAVPGDNRQGSVVSEVISTRVIYLNIYTLPTKRVTGLLYSNNYKMIFY